MFKGIVMEITNEYVIVMKDDSTMVKIQYKDGLNIGDSIFFSEEDVCSKAKGSGIVRKNKPWVKIGMIAAILAIVLLPILNFIERSNNACAMVTLDINPSLEIRVNSEGKIIKVKGINDDGNNLDLNTLIGLAIEEGIVNLKKILGDNKYLDTNNSLLVGFAFLDKEDTVLEEEIQNSIKTVFNDMNIAYLKGSKEDLEKAEKKGISLGRYEAQVNLDEDLLEDEIEILTTEQIIQLIKNKGNTIYWSEEIIEELQDELEDRIEDEIDEEYYEIDKNDDSNDSDDNTDDINSGDDNDINDIND
ncbi:MAG: anti-sigma factor domain-containing protein, partial [Clostridium sp.]